MKKISKRVVFFGNERLATGVSTEVLTLQGLIENGYEVAGVIANYEQSRSRSERSLEIADAAREHNIPIHLVRNSASVSKIVENMSADIGVLVAFGQIVPRKTIDLFPAGIINLHPSLLPRHRGSTPIESAILQNDATTGVSIMKLAAQMDAGPIYGQSELELSGSETKQQLSRKLLEIGSATLMELLPGILEGKIAAIPQDDSAATYSKRISKEDGVLDWTKDADELEREIRAYKNWPNSRTMIAHKDVIITKSSVLPLDGIPGNMNIIDNNIVVFCTNGALKIEKLKPAGKREMTSTEFLAGNKI